MKTFNISLTDELYDILDALSVKHGEPMAVIIEDALRQATSVRSQASRQGIRWSDRPKRGRPAKAI